MTHHDETGGKEGGAAAVPAPLTRQHDAASARPFVGACVLGPLQPARFHMCKVINAWQKVQLLCAAKLSLLHHNSAFYRL